MALVALAGPVWSQLPQPVFRAESALVMLLDVSRSMDAQDLAPSRLTRAKHKILDILQARQEGQTALVIFSGEAFVVSPLTDDARTMKTLVQTLETNLMPVQGSRPDLALKMGNELLEQAGIPGGALLLVMDGNAELETLETIKQLASKGRKISVLGVGTEEGAPIPEKGGFVKDETGAIVVTKLDLASLQAAAHAKVVDALLLFPWMIETSTMYCPRSMGCRFPKPLPRLNARRICGEKKVLGSWWCFWR